MTVSIFAPFASAWNVFRTAAGQSENLISSSSPAETIPKTKPDIATITTQSGCMATFPGSQKRMKMATSTCPDHCFSFSRPCATVNTIGWIGAVCRHAGIAGLDPPCPDVTISSNSDFEEESSLVPKSSVSISLGESPLTDPRSLGSSAVFHVLVVLLASLTALNVALPMAASRPKALYAEIDPVDNRADVPSSPGQGGGSPGRYRWNEQFAFYSAV